MTSATITEISVKNLPSTTQYGTSSRRCMVFVRCPALNGGSTLNLATYIPGLADVECVVGETDGGAVEGTATTWSTTTLTLSSGAAGVYEGCFICTLT